MADDARTPDDPPKLDPRPGGHEDLGVEVERDLSAKGHLARGDVTRFSTLRFHSQGRARTERDPVFERPLEQPPAAPPPAAASDVASAAKAGTPLDTAGESPPTLLQKMGRMLGL